jgi:hypothetical protein
MADPIPTRTLIDPEILALMGALQDAHRSKNFPTGFFDRMHALNIRMAALENTPEFIAEIIALTAEIARH